LFVFLKEIPAFEMEEQNDELFEKMSINDLDKAAHQQFNGDDDEDEDEDDEDDDDEDEEDDQRNLDLSHGLFCI